MTSPNEAPIWDLAQHTAAKHAILRNYLGGWYPKLGLSQGRVLFLDGFAGPGIYTDGSDGSPVIALRTLMDHPHRAAILNRSEIVYLFNEKDKARFESLERVVADLKIEYGGWPRGVTVGVHNQSFGELADGILEYLEKERQSLAPTFAFVDPFGYRDVNMAKLAKLLRFAKCELYLYFDFNSVVRFATAGNVDARLEALFGTDEFKKAPPTGPERARFLLKLYERQLRDVAKFEYVQAFAMKNQRGITGNYMIFASRHLDGLDLMKKAMWSVAPTGDYQFSDRLAGQDILIGMEKPDTTPLRHALVKEFGGKTEAMSAIERFVIKETPFHSGHIRRATLSPMQRDGLLETNYPRKRAFPDTCRVTFAPAL